jgi:hypothetical protein
VTDSTRSRLLHVANGSSTTRLIARAGLPGGRSIWADPLHDGPVPGGLTDAELLGVRRRYLEAPAGFPWTVWGEFDPSLDPANDLNEWRAALERRDAYDELVLWFEHDLFDQLNLVQLLTWIAEHLQPLPPVSLVCVGDFPGHPEFKGLGELSPRELGSLFPARVPVDERHYALARRVWDAFRASTPEPLDDVRRGDSSPLPYVAPALTRFFEDYPWTSDGLSRTERRLLELAEGGPLTLRQAFPRLHAGERFFYITYVGLADRAHALSRTPPPLITIGPPPGARSLDLLETIALTETGRAVLAGQMDRVTTCGIDRWFGGVHLHDGAQTWRWDPEHQRVVR